MWFREGLSPDSDHGVTSALIATLGVGSPRNSRRAGDSPTEQAGRASSALAEHAPVRAGFLTAIVGRLDLSTGTCDLINAGHLAPILVRDGSPREVTLPPWTSRPSSGRSPACTLGKPPAP